MDQGKTQQTRGRQAEWPFPEVRKIGTTAYVGLQVFSDDDALPPSEIEPQTHHVFGALESRLNEVGATMSQLTKLHTYYLFNGDGRAVTDYWERMTAARLDHLSNPSAAATALRVAGVGRGRSLIGADGIAEMTADKGRIMPDHEWDWSIPTPFSQGWRAGDTVYVGGQISADRKGHTIAPGDVVAQTTNTLEYIRHVLLDADSGWENVVSIKIAHQWTHDAVASRALGEQILREVARCFPKRKPALITLGVDLLYEGLLLEIDAVAVKGETRPVYSIDDEKGATANEQTFLPGHVFPAAWIAGDAVYIGAHCAPDHALLAEQLQQTLIRLAATLQRAGARIEHLVKINVYYCAGAHASMQEDDIAAITNLLDGFLEKGRTVVSVVQTAGLLHAGQRVQVDGVARLDQP